MFKKFFSYPYSRDILITIIILLALIPFAIFSPDAVKIISLPFGFIPSKLGIQEQVGDNDKHLIELANPATPVQLNKAGLYALYSNDIEVIHHIRQYEASWLTLEEQATKLPTTLWVVERGVRPYDTLLARGRPLLRFQIVQPGSYVVLQSSGIIGTLTLVPDPNAQREKALNWAYAMQFFFIIAVVLIIYYRRYQWEQAQQQLLQAEKQKISEPFWQQEIERMRQENSKTQKPP